MMPMLREIFKGMGRETDGEFVIAIHELFAAPVQDSRKATTGNH
jgi:hypothetical protein